MESNRKGFYKYIAGKMNIKEKAGLLLNGVGDLVKNKTKQKCKMLRYSIFFSYWVFTDKIFFQASQIPELMLILWNIMLPTVWEDRVRKNLSHLDILKFMGLLDGAVGTLQYYSESCLYYLQKLMAMKVSSL